MVTADPLTLCRFVRHGLNCIGAISNHPIGNIYLRDSFNLMDFSEWMKTIRGMEQITFKSIRLQKELDGLRIIHLQTGGSILLSVGQVERWAFQQLRKMFA